VKKIVTVNHALSLDQLDAVFDFIHEEGYSFDFDEEKLKLTVHAHDELNSVQIRLPISYNSQGEDQLPSRCDINYVLLLIQSGSAALGFFENDINLDHKVFKSYTVRKKQGKSQLKYLNAKGKSRAGSRVRLANTIDFFENVNERLQDYFEEYDIDKIAMSCSKTLIPFVFNSKVNCPFDKKDDRIYKIPKHIHTPGYDILMSTHEFLMRGEANYREEDREFSESLWG